MIDVIENEDANMKAEIKRTTFVFSFLANGLKMALVLSKLIATNSHEVAKNNRGKNNEILQRVSPSGQWKVYSIVTIAEAGIKIDDKKSSSASTITNFEPGRSEGSPVAKYFTTKALPKVPTRIVSEYKHNLTISPMVNGSLTLRFISGN